MTKSSKVKFTDFCDSEKGDQKMEQVEHYAIKMNNEEYFSLYSQESDEYVEGYTTKEWSNACPFSLEEVKEIVLAFKEGKKLSGTCYGKVIPELFELRVSDKTIQPISYIKIISKTDKETIL